MRVIRQGTESSFNSRSPSGLRPRVHQSMLRLHLFQFTQPKRAATTLTYGHAVFFLVSIHAAQAGCDYITHSYYIRYNQFQFTQPKRAATHGQRGRLACLRRFQFTQPKRAATDLYCYIEDWANVSIHAAQAGCDQTFTT